MILSYFCFTISAWSNNCFACSRFNKTARYLLSVLFLSICILCNSFYCLSIIAQSFSLAAWIFIKSSVTTTFSFLAVYNAAYNFEFVVLSSAFLHLSLCSSYFNSFIWFSYLAIITSAFLAAVKSYYSIWVEIFLIGNSITISLAFGTFKDLLFCTAYRSNSCWRVKSCFVFAFFTDYSSILWDLTN